jgi:hypothetical protein
MTDQRVQGDPWDELCAVSEGFCPDCLTPLGPRYDLDDAPPDWCSACQRVWGTFWTTDGWPGYTYQGSGWTEWYYALAGGKQ